MAFTTAGGRQKVAIICKKCQNRVASCRNCHSKILAKRMYYYWLDPDLYGRSPRAESKETDVYSIGIILKYAGIPMDM